MEIRNSAIVPTDLDTAWRTLLDIPAIAPCMPGATLESQDGDAFTGNVKVKLGPVAMTFGGEARFLEKDDAAHRAVIEGNGKEAKGNGTARALVTAQLTEESPSSTRLDIVTDLTITGKAAQFGKGVMQDISTRLVAQFAGNLEQLITSRGAASVTTPEQAAGPASVPGSSSTSALQPQSTEALNLGSVAMVPILRRIAPVIAIVAVAAIAWFLLTR